MDNKKRIKYERIAKITGILIGLVFVLGTSYAVFKTVTRSEETNTISAGKLDVQIENEQDEILLQKAYPITEEEGLKQSPYTFEIVNKGSINAEYDLYIEIEENTTLPLNVVRYYLTVEEEGVEKIVTEKARLISQEETTEREGKSLYKIDTKYLDTTKTNKYKLYLWIDYEATKEEASNKYFEGKVVVDAVQIYDKNRLVKQVDVSEAKDGSVLAYMYADGTVYIKGKGTIASGLSETLVYDPDEQIMLKYYKKVLIQMGCDEEEVNIITSFEELEEYVEEQASNNENFNDEFDNALVLIIAKETLEEMGQDTSSITDMESLMSYLVEIGYMDEEGNTTEEGEKFFTKYEEKYNTIFSTDPIPATKIVLEDGIENIPNGLYTGNEAITEVRIPASVVSIDDSAFYGCRGLTEIVIPDSVTSIGYSTFSNCTNLTKVTIPNSVVSIGASAFYNCSSLTTVDIPDSVTSIGNSTFSNCSSLKEIEIPNSVISIGNNAFQNCISLTEIEIPNNVTSIENYAFYNCNSLTEIEIPTSVTSIGTLAFYNCSSLTTVDIPDSVTSIGDNAFYNCNSLKEIEIPDNITSIGNNAFRNCTSLTSITIPNSVISIGNYAFNGCSGIKKLIIDGTKSYPNLGIPNIEELIITGIGNMHSYTSDNDVGRAPWYSSRDSIKSVILSNNLTSIGTLAFYNCSSLTEIEIPDSATDIGNAAFRQCTNLTNITISENVTRIGNAAFSGCTSLTEIILPESVISIENYAFNGCISLTEIEIPTSVTSIETYAFSSCIGIKKLTIDGTKNYGNLDITTIEELVITGTGNMYNYINYNDRTPWYSSRNSIKSVILSNSLTSIGNYAFRDCISLTNITIPDSVTSIGNSAFSGCDSLTNFIIPNSVTSIGNSAFSQCENLNSIIIPNSVTSIGDSAFFSCTSLTNLTIPNSVTSMGTSIVRYCTSLTNITLPESITEIGEYTFSDCTSLTSVTIPNSVTSIGIFAFQNCSSLTNITIPNSVTSMGNSAFEDWTSNQTINIDNTEAYVNANWNSNWKSICSAQINYLRS